MRDQLLAKYNSFPVTDLDRLERMLPNNVDNVRLILEIDQISSRYGMPVRNITISGDAGNKKGGDLIGRDEKTYGSVVLTFSIDGSYSNFISFISDLEKSLRIVDIQNISISASDGGAYHYDIGIRTYWLK